MKGGRRRWRHRIKEVAEVLLITAGLALLLRACVIDAVHVPSPSMEKTILSGDFLLVNKLVYGATTPRNLLFLKRQLPAWHLPGIRAPRRGDVVEFFPPDERDGSTPAFRRSYVKRIIGLPSELVAIRGGVVTVNERQVQEPETAAERLRTLQDFTPVRVPRKGDRIVLRQDAMDEWEPIVRCDGHTVVEGPGRELLIDGRPQTVYEVSQDYYFVLGDNITNSSDSREWGFLPFDHIVGIASLVYWSAEPELGVRWSRIGTLVR
jgi:signal peptidase I